ncbi:hypothetical protein [Phyllobacterium lublinensis]|uniref:hypothetical protein n=1 Tax=Phyllobacterium lublinensis TaxID=2875708 RepID=UPI001CC9D33F|nr:hypothetical protein [Phyllobacterium sp. 2063]MBZ9655040.1 hypothetical protein [Phyllobacterium sp. 2063]
MVAPELQADINPPLSTLLLSSMNVAFAAGLLLPRLMRMVTFWPIALLIGIPLAFVVPADDWTTLRWTVSLTCVLLVGAAAQLPQITSERWLSKTAIRFGNWSYTTYLIHCTVLWLWFQYFQGYAHPTRIWLFGLVLVAIATAALGWLDVKLYEKLRDVVKYASFDRKRIAGSIYVATFVLFCVLGVALA